MNQYVLSPNNFRERMELEITATLDYIDQSEALLACREAVVAMIGDLYDRIDAAFQTLDWQVKHKKFTRKEFIRQMQEADLSGLCWKKIQLNFEEKYKRTPETEEFQRFRETIRNHAKQNAEVGNERHR